MVIAYLSTFYPYRGGIAQFSASLYRELEKKTSISAYTFTRQYPHFLFPGTSQYSQAQDAVDPIPATRLLDSINPFSYRRTAKTILKKKPHLLLTRFWIPFLGLSIGKVARILKKHKVVTIAIVDNVVPHEKRWFDRFLTNYFLKQHDGFVVMSESVRDDLLKLKSDARITIQPHPLYDHFGQKVLSEEARKILNLPLDKKIVLFFGIIRAYKGLDLLIEAFQYIHEDTLLVIAGEPYENFREYQVLIDKFKLGDRVYLYTRYIPNQEVSLFFSAADVCVLPYRSATQSGIIPICYHFDLPVVATNVGGLKEVIDDQKTGFILTSFQPQVMAEKINYYFSNQLKDGFIESIKKYKKRFTWESFSDSIIALYHSILQEQSKK